MKLKDYNETVHQEEAEKKANEREFRQEDIYDRLIKVISLMTRDDGSFDKTRAICLAVAQVLEEETRK